MASCDVGLGLGTSAFAKLSRSFRGFRLIFPNSDLEIAYCHYPGNTSRKMYVFAQAANVLVCIDAFTQHVY